MDGKTMLLASHGDTAIREHPHWVAAFEDGDEALVYAWTHPGTFLRASEELYRTTWGVFIWPRRG